MLFHEPPSLTSLTIAPLAAPLSHAAVNFSFVLDMDLTHAPSLFVAASPAPTDTFGFAQDGPCNVLTHGFACHLDSPPAGDCAELTPGGFDANPAVAHAPPEFSATRARFHASLTLGGDPPCAAALGTGWGLSVMTCLAYYPLTSAGDDPPILAQACRSFDYRVTLANSTYGLAAVVSSSHTPQPVLQPVELAPCAGNAAHRLRIVYDLQHVAPGLSFPLAFAFSFGALSFKQKLSETQVVLESDACFAGFAELQAALGAATDPVRVPASLTVHFTQQNTSQVLKVTTTEEVEVHGALFDGPPFVPPGVVHGASVSPIEEPPPLIGVRTGAELPSLVASDRVVVDQDALCVKLLLQDLPESSFYTMDLAMVRVCLAGLGADLDDAFQLDPGTGRAQGCRSSQVLASTERVAVYDNEPLHGGDEFEVDLLGPMTTARDATFALPAYADAFRTLANVPGPPNLCDAALFCLRPRAPYYPAADAFVLVEITGALRPFASESERSACLHVAADFPEGRASNSKTVSLSVLTVATLVAAPAPPAPAPAPPPTPAAPPSIQPPFVININVRVQRLVHTMLAVLLLPCTALLVWCRWEPLSETPALVFKRRPSRAAQTR